ncbi:uncharacterized protein LOC135392405 [Ornithodoros turicata]|uniref:uncharacterized protein LOC135392405 n=1 Tax=Ornithodoros turicata TaxID=34597 RepID=UPI00313A4CF8
MATLPAQLSEHVNITIYADDLCIWASSTRRDVIQRRLQGALDIIVSYLSDRGLSISPSKTVAMAFTCRAFRKFPLRVDGQQLAFVRHHKYLGITIDRELTWSKHVKALSTAATTILNVLRRISGSSWGPSYPDLRQVHISLVLGLLRYSLPVLHGLSSTTERELLNIQARSLRVCLGVPKTTDTFLVLAEAKETPAHVLRDLETLRSCARYRTRHAAHYLRDIHLLYENSAFGAAVCRLAQSLPPPPSRLVYAPPLWTLVLPPTDLLIPDMSRKNDTPVLAARQFALGHLKSVHGQRKAIFTDGSVVYGASSAAFYMPHGDTAQAFKLPHETSSTEAELTVIYEAFNAISGSQADSWSIFTDNTTSSWLPATAYSSSGYPVTSGCPEKPVPTLLQNVPIPRLS